MGAPLKKSLDYFPLYVDDPIRKSIIRHLKDKHYALYIELLMFIAKNDGYYFCLAEKSVKDFLWSLRKEKFTKTFQELLQFLISSNCNGFDIEKYKRYTILTNPSLQKWYINATSKREHVILIKEYLLQETSDFFAKNKSVTRSQGVELVSLTQEDSQDQKKNRF